MTIWFTSDTHFNHENIIKHDSRPFTSMEDMTEQMVERWNARVGKGDEVFHLGDFALTWGSKDKAVVDSLLSRLNGNKWLILGNHDRDPVTKNNRWQGVSHYRELKIDMGEVHKQRIVLFHYSLRTWNQQGRGSWCLHGHSHGSLPDIGGKTIDVGVTRHNYQPISLEEVAAIMAGREGKCEDHHKEAS